MVERKIDQSVFVAYGQAVLGMQAIEQSLKIAIKEVVIELDQATEEAREEISRLPLGALIDRFARIVPSRFGAQVQDLRNFKENRNYVAHQFFIDFIAARDNRQNDDWAIEFLQACEPEVVLALHRVESMAVDLKLPILKQHSQRHDLRLMPHYGLRTTDRISIRRISDA